MRTLIACLPLCLAAATGCGDRREAFPVAGTVELRPGEPVNVGLIEFVPVTPGPSARGRIEAGGFYALSTFGENDGAPPGEYVVIVSQPQLVTGAIVAAPEGHADEHHGGEQSTLGIVPPKFGKRNESPLRATVERRENRSDFVLVPRGD